MQKVCGFPVYMQLCTLIIDRLFYNRDAHETNVGYYNICMVLTLAVLHAWELLYGTSLKDVFFSIVPPILRYVSSLSCNK